MEAYPEKAHVEMEALLTQCDHILETHFSDEELADLQNGLRLLQTEAEAYRVDLADKEAHSCSGLSRGMASMLLTEDRRVEDYLASCFSPPGDVSGVSLSDQDRNVGALYVEYLTGRARQSVREALIGAARLKLLTLEDEGLPG